MNPALPIPTLALAPVTSVLIWAGVLIVVVMVGGGFLLAYRRRLFENQSHDEAGVLDGLRAMRDQGRITPDEFDAARKRMAARIAGVAPPPSAATKRPPLDPGSKIARPGFDLTGAPLPTPRHGPNPKPDKSNEQNGSPEEN